MSMGGRIARLEQRRAAVIVHVVQVRFGETDDEAFARHGRVGPCIVVPERATEAELPILEEQWAEQQRRLIADAKAERKEKHNASTEHCAREHRSRRITYSGRATGQPNEGVVGRPLAVRTRH